MALNDFRAIYLPYCLKKQKDGNYIILNREHNLGFNTSEHIDYSDYLFHVK